MRSYKCIRWNLSIHIILILLASFDTVLAGWDRFTFVDEISGWTIESKVNSTTGNVSCRASIHKNGSWFSARTRLDKNDELILLSGMENSTFIDDQVINEVKIALNNCRDSLLYIN